MSKSGDRKQGDRTFRRNLEKSNDGGGASGKMVVRSSQKGSDEPYYKEKSTPGIEG